MIGRWMPASRREARMASARCMSATSRAPSSRSGRGCGALASPRFCETARRRRGSWSAASAEGGKGFGRAPAPSMEEQVEEIKARDMLIDALLEAAQGGEGPVLDIVSESLFALDKDFWMRFAMRTDSCETAEDKERMADLATLVMKFTEAMVKQSEKSLDSAQTWLIQLLKEAADDKGQWHLPLNEAEIERMRTFLKTKLMDPQPQSQSDPEAGGSADLPPPCDMESLLATSYAWMRKATNDEENKEAQQVVPLLQKVLQLYASEYLLNFSQGDLGMLQAENEDLKAAGDLPSSDTAKGAMEALLKMDEAAWEGRLADLVQGEAVNPEGLLVELQKKMELIVLGMRGGMYEQRVLVEYLQELEERVNQAFGISQEKE